MISRSTGEVYFSDGLRLVPHVPLMVNRLPDRPVHSLPLPGWNQHFLGTHESDKGAFEVEAICGSDCCLRVVMLAHVHPFYDVRTPDDAERRVFHEGVISSDLGGQREFAWGQVLCRFDSEAHKDWLIVAYSEGPQVPLRSAEVLLHLFAHESPPT